MAKSYRYIVCLVLCLLGGTALYAQTSASGVVVDADTGERLPFVQIYFIKPASEGSLASQYGTTSDVDGNFTISNPKGYTTINFQMMGYKTEMYTLKSGQVRKNLKIKMKPDVYGLQDIVVTPKHRKQEYRRKGNPAVELIRNVIARKDSFTVKTQDQYVADTYTRMAFALDNFQPDFNKGFWHSCDFIQKYIDTTGVNPAITLSIRENIAKEYYQRRPHREKRIIQRKRHFGLESLLSTESLETNLKAIFKEIDINDNDMDLLFNRFVSPLNSTLAVAYYQYYIMDTLMVEGEQCIDLAFVPVNSESFSFTGHLYIVNDSTYKLKKYAINIPPHINLNFVSDFSVEHTYMRTPEGLWAPERTTTFAKFYIANRKKTLQARSTKLYTGFDFQENYDRKVFSSMMPADIMGHTYDTLSVREDLAQWDTLRPEPLSFYEASVMDLLDEFKRTPRFNTLLMTVDAMTTEYVATVPSSRWGESKWDFGPIYNTVSWNPLEGVRLRVGGTTTANVHRNLFFSTYAAFGIGDLRPKGNVTLLYSFNKKKYHQFEPLRHYLSLSAQYDVEEPGIMTGIVDRDNILMSIHTSTPVLKNYQYVLRARAYYMKEWPNKLTLKASFDYENNEAAGAMTYDRIIGYGYNNIALTRRINAYNCYEAGVELRYSPGSDFPINRMGVETPFTLEQDAPVISISHKIGYLDDRATGGAGYFYNRTELTAEKRFWFSSFGHLDARIQTGMVWNKVPFTKLYMPTTTAPSIFLGKNCFNLMQPMEFMMDEYVALYMTYYFKGWILNRIPGINRLKLRGVVSFSGIYGGLTAKNNPYLADNEGLYRFPDSSVYGPDGEYQSGYTSSPIGKMPYMEITAGLENILKFVRIDYVRRLTYNDYLLPDGVHRRKMGAWGRNGVKITVRFAL